jgi:hypothetical protein
MLIENSQRDHGRLSVWVGGGQAECEQERQTPKRRLRRATGVCEPSPRERHVPEQRLVSEANMKGELTNLIHSPRKNQHS